MKKLICMILICLLAGLSASAEAALPDYRYAGDNPYTAAICDWLLKNEADNYAQSDVAIPSPIIVDVDDDDPQDILVWGGFELNWYELRNTTLFCISGGSVPGLMHLQEQDGICVVSGFEAVGDGTDYQKDIERIFGMRRGLVKKLEAAMAGRDEMQLQFVSDYVNANGLNITQMQDYGWLPVPLINAPETAEEDQIVHHVSPLGYSIDYDLRTFSFDRFDESTEGLSGVGDLAGISILVEKHPLSSDDALAGYEKDMTQPMRKAATIGADSISVILLRDAALPEGVHKNYYLITAEDACFVISTSNTYYAFADAAVVDGADDAIENTVAAFRIHNDK